MTYFYLFLAGALLCNAIPHLVSGVLGQRFFTPWARPRGTGRSSAVQNALWGGANLAAGLALVAHVWGEQTPHGAKLLLAGFLVAAVGTAALFGRRVDKGL